MDTAILEELGLSKSESKVYLSLLELGQTKIGSVIEKSGIVSSVVHTSINTLVNKGLVSYIKKGKIKFYEAVSPKQLVNFLEGKKKKLLEILPELESKQKISKEKPGAEIFEGFKGIMSMLDVILNNSKKKDEYLFFSSNVQEENKEIQEFFKRYDVKRKEKGLIVRGLAPITLKELYNKRRFLNIKYTNLPIPSDITICNDYVGLISWGEKPVGYLIKSNQISNIQREFFNRVWEKSK